MHTRCVTVSTVLDGPNHPDRDADGCGRLWVSYGRLVGSFAVLVGRPMSHFMGNTCNSLIHIGLTLALEIVEIHSIVYG